MSEAQVRYPTSKVDYLCLSNMVFSSLMAGLCKFRKTGLIQFNIGL